MTTDLCTSVNGFGASGYRFGLQVFTAGYRLRGSGGRGRHQRPRFVTIACLIFSVCFPNSFIAINPPELPALLKCLQVG